MKSFVCLTLAAVAAAAAVARPAVSTSADEIPHVQTLPSWNRPDAVVKKIRFGPFKLPAATMKNGELVSTDIRELVPMATKPCDGECTILMMAARVEYANGTDAPSPGIYMHHAAMLNSGPGVTDGTCNSPGVDMFFSSGNEKSTVIFTSPNATLNSGYPIAPGHIFIMQTELQNQEPIDKVVYVAYSFEIVPSAKLDYHTKVAWISADMAACNAPVPGLGLSEDVGNIKPLNNHSFSLSSIDWVSPYDGEILACGGHMHDGGITTKVYKNGELFCDSVATYAEDNSMPMPMPKNGLAKRDSSSYLQSMSGCVMKGPLKKGDKIMMTAHYDFDAHPGMKKADGSFADIMALATCFFAAKQ